MATLAALWLVLGAALSHAQAPPAVPALPDAARDTSYNISNSTCICSVGFALFASGNDIDAWVTVWLNGTRYLSTDPTFGWSLSSPSGSLGTIARPITNAVFTFNSAQTGFVHIVGAERPRRLSQFPENRGVAARDLNQAITDLVAQNRETWDRTNDVTGRGLLIPPGTGTMATLPQPSLLAGGYLCFDATGLIPKACGPLTGTGNVAGPNSSTAGHFACWNNTTGTLLNDCGTGGSVGGPGTSVVNGLALWSNTAGTSLKDGAAGSGATLNGGPLTINPTGSNNGINMNFFDAAYGIQVTTVPKGAPGSYSAPSGIQSSMRYTVSADSSDNPNGVYGDIWYASAHTFTGVGSATRGNAYTVPVITATIASGGSNNVVGDVLTIVGGTCNTDLNTPPTFAVSTVSSGVVTAVSYQSQTACTTYPSNPVTTTSSNGGATPPTLNLTVASLPSVTNLVGLYGRARHQSKGTTTNAIALYGDGCYNSGGGSVTNCIAAWLQPTYEPGAGGSAPTNSYGVFFNGNFGQGSISASSGSDITITPSGGGAVKVSGGILSVVTGSASINTFLAESGASNQTAAYALGRNSTDGRFAVAANSGDFSPGSSAGDVILQGLTNVWISSNANVATKAALKADTSGNITLPQYSAGIAHFSGAGLVSSSAVSLTADVTGVLPVANGGSNCSSASITCFNNITGFSAAGTTGTTSTNLVFSTSPTLVTPTLGVASATTLTISSGAATPFTATSNSTLYTTFQCNNVNACATGFAITVLDGSGVSRNHYVTVNGGGPTLIFQTSVNGNLAFGKDNGSGGLTQQMTLSNAGGLSVGTASDPGVGLIYQNSASFLMRTKTSWNNGAAGNTATLTNAPAATNPTKWIPVDDNGTTRYIPAW